MLRFIDGFKHYGTADMAKKWSHIDGITIYNAGAPTGGGHAVFTGIQNAMWKSFDAQRVWIVGVRHRWSGLDDSLHRIMYGSSLQIGLHVRSGGYLTVLRSTSNTEIARSAEPLLIEDAWKYIEMKVYISSTSGTVDVRVDGQDVINLSGINTNPLGITDQTATTTGFGTGWVDADGQGLTDYYVCDGQGSLNNDFLGDVEVQTLYPNAAGNNSQWTPLSGDNYTNVDESVSDNDTSYVYASSAGTIDTYEYDSMTAVSGVVHGIQHNIWARKAMSGSVSVAPVTRPNATDYTGESQTVASTYADLMVIEETNPDTGLTWTISEVNAAQFGQKVVA